MIYESIMIVMAGMLGPLWNKIWIIIPAVWLINAMTKNRKEEVERWKIFFIIGIIFTQIIFSIAGENKTLVAILLALLFYISFKSLSQGKKNIVAVGLVFIIVLIAQWALLQFILQDDLGLQRIGETNLEAGKAGIATFSNWGENDSGKTIRAYGIFPHPNILGGVSAISMMILLNLISVEELKATRRKKGEGSYYVGVYILWLCINISFSRLAIISSVIALMIFLGTMLKQYRPNEQAGFKMKTEKLLVSMMPILIIGLVMAPFWMQRINDSSDKGLSERVVGYKNFRKVLNEKSIWIGSGIGSYKNMLDTTVDKNDSAYRSWQIDYVHSTPLLMFAELGMAGVIIITVGIIYFIERKIKSYWYWLVPIVPIIMFDHYPVTQAAALQFIVLYMIVLQTRQELSGNKARLRKYQTN